MFAARAVTLKQKYYQHLSGDFGRVRLDSPDATYAYQGGGRGPPWLDPDIGKTIQDELYPT